MANLRHTFKNASFSNEIKVFTSFNVLDRKERFSQSCFTTQCECLVLWRLWSKVFLNSTFEWKILDLRKLLQKLQIFIIDQNFIFSTCLNSAQHKLLVNHYEFWVWKADSKFTSYQNTTLNYFSTNLLFESSSPLK